MSLSIQRIGRIFQIYQTQERIADLNRQAQLRTVQNPSDRVTISSRARELAEGKGKPRKVSEDTPEAPPEPPPAPASAPPAPPADDSFTPLHPAMETSASDSG